MDRREAIKTICTIATMAVIPIPAIPKPDLMRGLVMAVCPGTGLYWTRELGLREIKLLYDDPYAPFRIGGGR